MRYGIPLLGNRIAPRCTIAEAILLITIRRNKVSSQNVLPVESHNWEEILRMFVTAQVDTLVCGGISRSAKEAVLANRVAVIDNVAGTVEELVLALQKGTLRVGYGLQDLGGSVSAEVEKKDTSDDNGLLSHGRDTKEGRMKNKAGVPSGFDCLACRDRVCLRGEACEFKTPRRRTPENGTEHQMMESAMDISCERDRTLCRLSELIYFCLGMKYKRIGVAFCIDLLEPTEILVAVLRRFFEVYPVCCKIGGIRVNDPFMNEQTNIKTGIPSEILCNPVGQAAVMNKIGVDLNVIVGLCMGADCVFTRHSQAPVTTLFVKDRSLANNPIGALYSEYYLKEAYTASVGWV
ncbi:MAG: DUF1847 domain-containing protein [candidate division Zixibacteria bacterium]|nr:DUF1847 domain-containing protein [candidate division Zixibacteria bacterium]